VSKVAPLDVPLEAQQLLKRKPITWTDTEFARALDSIDERLEDIGRGFAGRPSPFTLAQFLDIQNRYEEIATRPTDPHDDAELNEWQRLAKRFVEIKTSLLHDSREPTSQEIELLKLKLVLLQRALKLSDLRLSQQDIFNAAKVYQAAMNARLGVGERGVPALNE
jgi:hypothetical protein